MKRLLPSLAALEAFDAVARLGSTTRAAGELGRTQSAISRQIAVMEAVTGQRLFDRSAAGLRLTLQGRALFEPTNQALDLLDRSIRRTRTDALGERRLLLRVWPTFGARWLGARLADLPKAGIEVEVELSVSMGVDAEAELRGFKVDAGIIFGAGDWPGIASYRLLYEDITVVGAPRLVARHGDDLAAYPWLHMNARPGAWRRWLTANGRAGMDIKAGSRHDVGMLVELASLGMGLAALPSVYVERELAAGQLVAPFGPPVRTGRGYYLCYLERDAGRAEFIAFRRWLLAQC